MEQDLNINAICVKSQEYAKKLKYMMWELGVTSLGCVSMTVAHNQTHGTSDYLHVNGCEGDLSTDDVSPVYETIYEFGDYNLPYSYPTLNDRITLLSEETINSVNDAIIKLNDVVKSSLNVDTSIPQIGEQK